MFELRLIPSPRKPLENAINHYFTPNMITGNYGFRKTLPFLILNPDEIANLIQLTRPNKHQKHQDHTKYCIALKTGKQERI